MMNRRQFFQAGFATSVGALLFGRPGIALAADSDCVRIEEDWLIEVASPDLLKNSPELVTSISPEPGNSQPVAALLINHRTFPSYAPGGVQLQVWQGGHLLDCDSYPELRQLDLQDETISFTFVMSIEDSNLTYQIINAGSETFGDFGTLTVTAPRRVDSLDRYRPDDSVARSTVNVGTQRLSKYVLKSVRWFGRETLLQTEDLERSVI